MSSETLEKTTNKTRKNEKDKERVSAQLPNGNRRYKSRILALTRAIHRDENIPNISIVVSMAHYLLLVAHMKNIKCLRYLMSTFPEVMFSRLV